MDWRKSVDWGKSWIGILVNWFGQTHQERRTLGDITNRLNLQKGDGINEL